MVSPVVVGRTKSSKKGQLVGGRRACARCEQLQRALEAAQSDLQAAQEREAGLQAQLANLQQLLFGRKSEATPAGEDDPSATAGVAAEPSAEETPAAATPAPDPSASEDPLVRPRRQRGREPGSPTPAARAAARPARGAWSGWTCPRRSAAVRTAVPPTCRAGTRSGGAPALWSGLRVLLSPAGERPAGCPAGHQPVGHQCVGLVSGPGLRAMPSAGGGRPGSGGTGAARAAVDAVDGAAAAGASVRPAGCGDRGGSTAAGGGPGRRDLLAGAVAGHERGRHQGPASARATEAEVLAVGLSDRQHGPHADPADPGPGLRPAIARLVGRPERVEGAGV